MTLNQLWVSYLLPGCLTCPSFSCGLPLTWVFDMSPIQVWFTSSITLPGYLTWPSFRCRFPITLGIWHDPHLGVGYLLPRYLTWQSFRCGLLLLTWASDMTLIQVWVTSSYLGIWHDPHSGVGYLLPGYLTWRPFICSLPLTCVSDMNLSLCLLPLT